MNEDTVTDELDPALMMRRLLNGAMKLLKAIECRIDAERLADSDERTLTGLSRSMEVLFGLLKKADAAQPATVDVDRLRGELLTRLEAWTKGRAGQVSASGTAG